MKFILRKESSLDDLAHIKFNIRVEERENFEMTEHERKPLKDTIWYELLSEMAEKTRKGVKWEITSLKNESPQDIEFILKKFNSISKAIFYLSDDGWLTVNGQSFMGEVKILKTSAKLENIVNINTQVIVNAANEDLLPGSGVCGAIHKASGPELAEECREIGSCRTGESVITDGYNLKKKVIHTVGPIYWKEKERAPLLLRSCYYSSLYLADINNFESIAFPAISTGVYGYPVEEAAKIAVETVNSYTPKNRLKEVVFSCFSEKDLSIYNELLKD